MVNFLQINLNHCWAAHQLLNQTVLEFVTDVIFVSDQLRDALDDESWASSADGKCAVVAVGPSIPLVAYLGDDTILKIYTTVHTVL